MSIAFDVTTLPHNQVAELVGLHPAIIGHLVAMDVLEGDRSVADLESAQALAAQLAAARQLVEDQPILISDAAQKYQFDRTSIYNWIKGGWVRVLEPEPRRRVNEGDIAMARALADMVGQLAGRPVFPSRPRPGRPKKQARPN